LLGAESAEMRKPADFAAALSWAASVGTASFARECECDAIKNRGVDELDGGNLCSTAEDGADFAAKAIARGGELVFAFGPETIEKIETHLSIEDGRGRRLETRGAGLFACSSSSIPFLPDSETGWKATRVRCSGLNLARARESDAAAIAAADGIEKNLLGSNISRRTQ